MKKFLSNKLNVVLSLILVALVATITIVTLNLLGINAKVEAIDFSNYTKEEVEQWIAENKLEEGKYTYTFEYDEVIEKDHVIYQSVKVGEPIEESLYIIYSKGENPDAEYAIMAIGEDTTKDELDKWFLTNGFSDVKYQYILSDKEVNTVLSINKASAKKYDEVIVTLSAKDDESLLCTVVPDLSLYSKEDLSLWAASNNIEIINNYEVNANMEEGTFIKQNPIAGSMVKPGSKLTITLSSKEEKADSDEINVPDSYLGYTEIKFVKAIEALGLKAQKSSSTMKNSKYQTGTVIAYDSTSDGKKFKKGDTVNYTLVDNGDKDQFVTVSDSFIGKTEAEFVKAMEALGLKAEKQKQTYKSNKYQTGVVYAYDSTSDGINFKKGDTVKYYLVDNGDANSEYVTVPDTYIGYTEENFVKAIEALGLKPVKQDKTYTSQKYKTGEVYIYESTSDGIKFKKGDTVKYYLVKNADANNTTEYVTVPDTYIGYTEENFVKAIEALGLKASKQDKTYTSQKYKTGEVYIYDSTSDGIKFKKGDTVKYYLVKNADSNNTTEYVTVPDSYIGYTEENFRKAIEALGLKPVKQDKTYTSQKYKTGEVYIYDSTSDGIKFKKGDSVKYYLVKNNDSTEKPNDTPVVQTKITLANQVGQSKDSANSYCTNNGLKAAFNETYSSTVAAGTIISMSPAAGSQVDKNSTVTFTVSKGAEPAKTAKILSSNTIIQFYSKNSYEETETAVKKYLSDAGFTNVSCVKPTITDENKNKFYNLNKGVVVSVSVGGNTDYTAGEYPVNTAIVVTILDKEIN